MCNFSIFCCYSSAAFIRGRLLCNVVLSMHLQTPLSGIPQGTVLGPVLFLIFINDLSELIQNQASFFADDTTLHATDKSLVSSCVSLSGDLDRAANWADRWGMLFSAPKSKHLPIGREAQQSPSVFMKGVPIPQVRTHTHLGLIFNSTLTWNDHILNLCTTCARMTGRNSATPWWKHSIIVYAIDCCSSACCAVSTSQPGC